MADYSGPQYQGTKEVIISGIKKDDVFIVENYEGMLKAKSDAFLSDDGGLWIVEAENEDFETKVFAIRKSDLAYSPKFAVVK